MKTTILPTLPRWWPTKRRTPILRYNVLKLFPYAVWRVFLFEYLTLNLQGAFKAHVDVHSSIVFLFWLCLASTEWTFLRWVLTRMILAQYSLVNNIGCLPYTRCKTLMGLVDPCISREACTLRTIFGDRLGKMCRGCPIRSILKESKGYGYGQQCVKTRGWLHHTWKV